MSRALRRLHVLLVGDQAHGTLTVKSCAAFLVSFHLYFANVPDLPIDSIRWAEFADLTDAFTEKQVAIVDHRFSQNLDSANQAWLLRRRVWLCFLA